VRIDAVAQRLPESVEVAFYYVATESLANAGKHAEARRVQIAVTTAAGQATLRVADDGRGGADPALGSGLTGLVDRLEAIGGRLDVTSTPDSGTTVTAVAPI
jgi:signal transduction histidine kinase